MEHCSAGFVCVGSRFQVARALVVRKTLGETIEILDAKLYTTTKGNLLPLLQQSLRGIGGTPDLKVLPPRLKVIFLLKRTTFALRNLFLNPRHVAPIGFGCGSVPAIVRYTV